MGKILCATRGGEASVRTQEAAIQRSKETGDELIFFFVGDVEFLAKANYALRSDVITDQLKRMADFLMTMACERAGKRGVSARFILKSGDFVEQLKLTVAEEAITLIILGRPSGDDASTFALSALEEFVVQLQEDTGIEVWIPPAE